MSWDDMDQSEAELRRIIAAGEELEIDDVPIIPPKNPTHYSAEVSCSCGFKACASGNDVADLIGLGPALHAHDHAAWDTKMRPIMAAHWKADAEQREELVERIESSERHYTVKRAIRVLRNMLRGKVPAADYDDITISIEALRMERAWVAWFRETENEK